MTGKCREIVSMRHLPGTDKSSGPTNVGLDQLADDGALRRITNFVTCLCDRVA